MNEFVESLEDLNEQIWEILPQKALSKRLAVMISLAALSVACCKDAAIENFLGAASVAGCKDAAIETLLAAVSVAGWKSEILLPKQHLR